MCCVVDGRLCHCLPVHAESKPELRKQLSAARRQVSPDTRHAEADALARLVITLFGGVDVVCAYVPVGTEPGSVAMLDGLVAVGTDVLLPVTETIEHEAQPLKWASYRPGGLEPASYGLLEPTGPLLPPESLAAAGVVVVPALAVDRRGARLGRGAGFYDRSLPFRDPSARLVAVVRDSELLDLIPAEPHDIPMTHALTPGAGLVTLGNGVGMPTAE